MSDFPHTWLKLLLTNICVLNFAIYYSTVSNQSKHTMLPSQLYYFPRLPSSFQDKQLFNNLVKHTETHNRVLEEEKCWREIQRQRREEKLLVERKMKRPRGTSAMDVQQALDAYERHLRYEAKRRLEESAEESKSGDLWHALVRKQDKSERWGHDGWEELQKPGPPPPLGNHFVKETVASMSLASKPTVQFVRKNEKPPASLPLSDPVQSHGKASKSRRKRNHEKKSKSSRCCKHKTQSKTAPETLPSDTSSLSTLHSDEEIEWLERK
ncbi:unnamed protein product [Dicrocoelium dendriticum]|nr:unnamed protein product [Dicrocoelium dendriticum]